MNRGAGCVTYKPLFFDWLGVRWGFEYSRVGLGPTPYLDRYILYAFGGTLRLHKFWRGDDDRAPHDHPWTFWTFPFKTYLEDVELLTDKGHWVRRFNSVRAWRWHRRASGYRHIVVGSWDNKPFWTLVITKGVDRKWGFWPTPEHFVPWRDWEQFTWEHEL